MAREVDEFNGRREVEPLRRLSYPDSRCKLWDMNPISFIYNHVCLVMGLIHVSGVSLLLS